MPFSSSRPGPTETTIMKIFKSVRECVWMDVDSFAIGMVSYWIVCVVVFRHTNHANERTFAQMQLWQIFLWYKESRFSFGTTLNSFDKYHIIMAGNLLRWQIFQIQSSDTGTAIILGFGSTGKCQCGRTMESNSRSDDDTNKRDPSMERHHGGFDCCFRGEAEKRKLQKTNRSRCFADMISHMHTHQRHPHSRSPPIFQLELPASYKEMSSEDH